MTANTQHVGYVAGGRSVTHTGLRATCADPVCAEEDEWCRTGRIRCSDCGTRVTTSTLETLPEHGCSRRQAACRTAPAT